MLTLSVTMAGTHYSRRNERQLVPPITSSPVSCRLLQSAPTKALQETNGVSPSNKAYWQAGIKHLSLICPLDHCRPQNPFNRHIANATCSFLTTAESQELGLTREKADMVHNEVKPESVSQGRALGEVGKVGTNASQKFSKQRLASKH